MIARARGLLALCAAAALSMPAYAQITITATDVSGQLAVGHALVSHADTLVTTLNVGTLGSTSWNFSGLANHTITTLTSVAPGTTPWTAQFPSATHCFSTTASLSGITGTVYEYLTLGATLTDLGNMGAALYAPGITASLTTNNSPADVVYGTPFTYNSTWTSNFTATQVIAFNGVPIQSTATVHNEKYVVDAYGPLTIPGGGTYNALRIRKQDSVTVKTVSYQILAANGANVSFKAMDPNGATTGTIAIYGATWSAPISTGVTTLPGTPEGYALMANYPNPFNPSTRIGYEIPGASRVRIAVNDLLGREVALLLDADQPAGRYEVTWDAKGMASGVYYCTMEAGSYRSSRAMILMK
jgi:hypothetical protein